MLAQVLDSAGRRRQPGVEVVVVVVRHRQQWRARARAARAAATMSSVAKATCWGSVTAGCPFAAAQQDRDGERRSAPARPGRPRSRLRTSPNGAATLGGCAGLQAEHRAVEQRRPRRSGRRAGSARCGRRGRPVAAAAGASPVGRKSARHSSVAAAVRRRRPRSRPGAATAGSSASAGPRVAGEHRREQRLGAARPTLGGSRGLDAEGARSRRPGLRPGPRCSARSGSALLPQLHRLGAGAARCGRSPVPRSACASRPGRTRRRPRTR